MNTALVDALAKLKSPFPVMSEIIEENNPWIFDFTLANEHLMSLDLNDEHLFSHYVFNTLYEKDCEYGIGVYNENRSIYQRSAVFGTLRTIHLGIDIWAPAGRNVYCPLDARVHSFADNNAHGDYGPTIILEHELAGQQFYTLYGHLNRDSLSEIEVGREIKAGQKFAQLGDYAENVHWPPHLHFQIISDIGDKKGDYPGVCALPDRPFYLNNCPNPNLLLRIPVLKNNNI